MTPQSPPDTKRRKFLKATGTGVATTLVAGCLFEGGNDGGGSGGGNDPIVISSLQPLSGPFSVYGPRHRVGAEFAAQQINANGGVRGRKIRVQTVDTESSGKAAANAFTEAIEQDNAVAGIGPGASEAAIRVGRIAEQNKVPLYLHAAGAVKIVPKDAQFTFRTALPATPTVGRAQAQIVKDRGYSNVGVIFEDGVWGDEYEAAMDAYFPDGLNVTRKTAPITQTDFVPQLRQFPNDIEMFLGTAHPAGVSSLYPQMYEIGLEPDLFLGAITPMEADYNAIGDSIDRSFASFNSTDMYADDYAEVASTFNEEVGGLFDHAQVNGYTAVQLVAKSIEEAGSTDPVDVAEATRTGTFDLLYGAKIEYTDWGEPKGSVQVYNSFDVGSSPDYWSNGKFAPKEEFRTDPLPAFEPGSLNL
ncbi:ABC transporter substrate-binding protein [Haladaptatus halobius]|uniref:ABC transporter substrate-binding protein n=1 Tax=Haladaptatus halobius TaxID=2884875 RepID=UPI001D09C0FA|nr:ABC transporter substrate-binding protein [Haladaptatus halobius]